MIYYDEIHVTKTKVEYLLRGKLVAWSSVDMVYGDGKLVITGLIGRLDRDSVVMREDETNEDKPA